MALAHLVGSAVERAYRRGDALEKRRCADAGMGRLLYRQGIGTGGVAAWTGMNRNEL
jgi:hypothetical protein